MKKYFILPILLIFTTLQLTAQKEYRLNKSSGKLILSNISNLSVEGYDGIEVIFTLKEKVPEKNLSTQNQEKTEDPRAKGLSALSNNGFDNTGIGLNIREKDDAALVSPVSDMNNKMITIKLPNSMSLSLQNSSWPVLISDSNSINIRNSKSGIDLSVQLENCKLENVTGPLSIKTLSGNVEIILNNQFVSPLSVYSVRGFIDVTVNTNTSADLSMFSGGGGVIYADKNLKLEPEQADKRQTFSTISSDSTRRITTRKIVEGRLSTAQTIISDKGIVIEPMITTKGYSVQLPHSGASSFNGTLNGGGGKIVLQSVTGNIYLRK